MPQTIAHPVWKMITLKTGPWSNKPCMGPTSLCIKFLEPKRGVGPGPRKMGPGWTRWDPGGTRWDPGGTHEDLAGLRWEKKKRGHPW